MTSDELAKLKAALEAAGEHVISALEVAENSSPENSVFISFPGQGSHSFDSSALLIDFGFSTWMENADDVMPQPLLQAEPLSAPVAEYVEHAIIAHLHSGDTIALAKLNAAFPTDDEHVIEVPQLVRKDAAIHPLSIYNFNGRSLDSHNPWHLEMSFEDYLALEEQRIIPELPRRIDRRIQKETLIHNQSDLIPTSFEETYSSASYFGSIIRNKVVEYKEAAQSVEISPPFYVRIKEAQLTNVLETT